MVLVVTVLVGSFLPTTPVTAQELAPEDETPLEEDSSVEETTPDDEETTPEEADAATTEESVDDSDEGSENTTDEVAGPPSGGPDERSIGVAAVAPSHAFPTSVTVTDGGAVGGTAVIDYGAPTGVTLTQRVDAVTSGPGGSCTIVDRGAVSGFAGESGALTYTEPDPPASSEAFGGSCFDGTNESTLVLNKPLVAPILHFWGLDASSVTLGGTSTTGDSIAHSTISKNDLLDVTGNTFNQTTQGSSGILCNDNVNFPPAGNNGGCGSFRLSAAGGYIQSFTFDNVEVVDGVGGDGWIASLSFPTAPLTKAFAPTTIAEGETSELTFSLTNPDEPESITLTPLDFTDTLPTGVTLASDSATDNGSCGAPTVDIATGGTVIEATAITVDPGDTCTITVTVTADAAGTYVNDNSNVSTVVGNVVPNLDATLTVTAELLPPPFPECVGTAFMVINNPSDWYDVDLVTGEPGLLDDDLGDADDIRVNAIGYSTVDDRVYGIDLTATSPVERTGDLVVIGADGAARRVGPVDDLAGAGFVNAGDVSPDGVLYATSGTGGTTIWAIDVDPASPGFLTMSTVTRVDDDGDAGGTDIGSDWAFGPDGVLYSIRNDGSLVTVDVATGEVDLVGPIDGLSSGGGAQFFDGEGFMYVYGAGVLYRADLDALEATEFGTGPSVTEADGARCPLAPLPIDFGDAPDSYGTLLADDGPRHGIPGLDAGTAPLMLGTTIDGDTDGEPSTGSDGDDVVDTVDDEDAVTGPIEFIAGEPTTVPVTVTNNTSQDATLAAWADLDGSGTFDAHELETATIAASSGTVSRDVIFDGAAPVCRNVRFRVFPGVVADPSPTGPASAGEVEDHPVVVHANCTADDVARTITGVAQAWTPDSSVQVPASSPASNALNAPDGVGTQLWSDATPPSVLTLDLATVVPEGNAVTLHLAQATASWTGPLRVTSSADGVTFGNPVELTPTATAPTFEAMDYVVPAGGVRFVRIVPLQVGATHSAVRVDAVTYSFEYCECEDAVNFVRDGDFESYDECSLQEGTFGAWRVIDHSVHIWGQNCPQGWTSPQGQNSIDLDGLSTGGIEQTVTGLTPGNTYNLSFYMAFNPAASAASSSMQVQIADFDETYTSASNATLGGFNLVHVEFTAGSATETLRFESLTSADDPALLNDGGTSGYGVVLDDIRITPKNCDEIPPLFDFGDAPDSYGTRLADDGPRHTIVPGLRLGSEIDFEADGQPGADADGDDTTDAADEDGVVFNPGLAYPSPTLRTGLDPVSKLPVTNTLDVDASADGFVSVWVDWNQDGDFDDADEQVAAAQAVTAGVNQVSFDRGTNPPSNSTYVRVRFSTDAASIATPTGPAPDGEVEDYRVLVERLVQPDTCVTGDSEYYAFTFSTPVTTGTTGNIGDSALYENVTVVNGVPVDMYAEVIDGDLRETTRPPNGFGVGSGTIIQTDDAQWNVQEAATLRYTFYEAGTTTPVAINGVFTISDMDGRPAFGFNETANFSKADLTSYAVTQGSAVVIVDIDGGDGVRFSGRGDWDGDPQSRFQIVMEDISTFDARWTGTAGSGFGFDGDGDLSINPPACEDWGDAPDSYGTTAAANGPNHTIVPGLFLGTEIDFDTDGVSGADADGDDADRLADEDGVADPIVLIRDQPTTVSVEATNTTGDVATLAGWIDLNDDGDFDDAGELQTIPVPAGTTAGDFALTFDAATFAGGGTYARFRLFPGDVPDPSPTGPAAGGEVEDYAVEGPILARGVCDASAYSFRSGGIGQPTEMFRISPDGATIDPVDTIPFDLNTVGYNQEDGYLYALRRVDNTDGFDTLVRISPVDGTYEVFDDTVDGVPTGGFIARAAMSGNILYTDAGGRLYTIDVTTNSVLGSVALSSTLSGASGPADYAYNPFDGMLYGYTFVNATTSRVTQVDPATGDVTHTNFPTGTGVDTVMGAQWLDGAGRLYGVVNTTSELWRIDDITTPTPSMTRVNTLTVDSGGGDGASCTPPDLLKDVEPDVVAPGATVTYTYTASNPTVQDLPGVTLVDLMPDDAAGRTYVGGTVTVTDEAGAAVTGWAAALSDTNRADDTLTISGLDIPRGERLVVTVDVVVATDSPSIVVENQATLTDLPGEFVDVPSDYPPTADVDDPTPLRVIVPFECASGEPGLLFQYPTGPTDIHNVDLVTGHYTTPRTIAGRAINAVGYNVLDDYVYGWHDLGDSVQMVRIGADGSIEDLETPDGMPDVASIVIGDIDENGQYWYSAGSRWYAVDLAPGSPTYMQVVGDGTHGGGGLDTMRHPGADWAYVPGGGDYLYRVARNTAGEAVLLAFNRATGQHEARGVLAGIPAATTENLFGAVYADAEGFLYASNNTTGVVYRIDVQEATAVHFADGPMSDSNDGARCFESRILIDFGDAPDAHGTTLGADGPRHGMVDYDDATGTAPLMLGATVDPENDGVPGADADGDGGDEDGVSSPIVMTDGVDTTVSVLATNTSGADAILAGWIDLDGSGTFDVGELQQLPVPDGSSAVSFDLTFPPATAHGDTYARFRLFPDGTDPADVLPTGPAAAGEVEDYPVEGTVLPPFECMSNAPGFLFQYPDVAGTGPTDVEPIEMVTGAQGPGMTIDGRTINATGYNVVDDYVYGWDHALPGIVKIGSDGSVEQLGVPDGVDSSRAYGLGELDEQGDYWFASASYWYRVDLTTMQIEAEGSLPNPAGLGSGYDWARVPGGGDYLYRVMRNTDGSGFTLVRFDMATGTQEARGFLGDLNIGLGGQHGALYADADGFLYASDNTTGEIYRIDVQAETATFFSYGPSSANNDGARCPDSPILLDFGDAPAGYATELASGGPRHGIQDYDELTGEAPLMLGGSIDPEDDGVPSVDADGDDTADGDDEDGVATPIVVVTGEATTVTVTVTNNTGEDATLAGWIDLDGNGTFDAGERQTLVVGPGTGVHGLDFPGGSATLDTYARFRLFPGTPALADVLPTGPVSAGEVEDYPVTVQLEPPPIACPSGSVLIPVEIIQNPSYETRTGDFVNDDSDSTIGFAENWSDSHPTGGQYHYFSPTFDSGPGPALMPVRSGAHGYGFMGGHSSRGVGEGATNVLAEPLVPGETYVGYFSMSAGGYNRQGDGYMEFFGTDDPAVGHIPHTSVVAPTATNIESLYQTGVVNFPGAGAVPDWEQQTFSLVPTQPWDHLRVEVRNADPAADGTVAGQTWINFDDFHMFRCEPQLTKDLTEITANGDGTHTVSYDLTVKRSGLADGVYDLRDTLRYGEGYDVVGQPTVTGPLGVTLNAGYDGEGDTLIADDVAIGAGDTHVYEVDVIVTIDTTTVTFESSDCELGAGESGTGLLNEASVEIDGETITDDSCELPPGEPEITKDVTSGPTPAGSGQFDIEYTISVTNDMAGAGEYDLEDELNYGDGVTVVSSTVANTAPGTITPRPEWNGESDVVVIEDQEIAGAADAVTPTVHTYLVTVTVDVAADITVDAADCTITGGESGTGLLNVASMNVNGEVSEAESCVEPPVTTIDKELASAVSNGDGTYTLTYELSVTRTGDGAAYDLTDEFRYGSAVTVVGVPAVTAPAGITPEVGFNGDTNTLVAGGVDIADGETHLYRMVVDVQVDAGEVTFENSDCDLTAGESGTGFSNEAAVTSNGTTVTDDTCETFPATTIDKDTTSGPTALANGNYEIEYTITVTNEGAAADVYDLTDELQFGDGIAIIDRSVVNETPGGITTRTEWDGEGDTLVVEDAAIDAATAGGPVVHEYTVTVEVDVPLDMDPAAADCQVGPGESGTGFLNAVTVTGASGPVTDDDCPPVPQTDFDKELVAKVANGDGTHTLSYELTVTREGTDGTYDLHDELLLNEAASLDGDPVVTNVTPGDVAVNAGYNGETDTLVAGSVDIAAGESHLYTIDVTVAVDLAAVTPENSDCVLDAGESGTGAMNQATLDIDNRTIEDDDCEPFPGTGVDKEITSGPTAMGGGRYEVEYTLTVSNSGAGTDQYDLTDELRYGTDVSVVSTAVVVDQPGITPRAAWNGEADTLIVENQPIDGSTAGVPASHVYTVTVVVEVPGDLEPSAADCLFTGGETGTGLSNEASVTGDLGTAVDDDCVTVPTTAFDKEVDAIVANGDGTYTVTYHLTVSRTGDGPSYQLVDTLLYGDAVTIEAPPVITAPTGVTPNALFDGETDTVVADGVPIADGETHLYEIAVDISVDAAAVTFENSDCTLTGAESGTGLMNTASVAVNDTTTDDEECPILPGEPLIEKSILSGPMPAGNGEFQMVYEITVTNPGAGVGVYDLDDELRYGNGITPVTWSVVTDQPTITPNALWDGVTETSVVAGQDIAGAVDAATPTVHTYTVTVQAEVAADVTVEAADCDLTGSESGTGFMNNATLETNGEISDDETCVEPPVTGFDKELLDVIANGDGTYMLTYGLTVTRTGDGPGYDLDDELQYGDAVSVDSVTADSIVPGGVVLNGGFDGESDTRIATDVAIGDGDMHLYEVRVEVTIDGAAATFESSDCDLGPGESGSGLSNHASATTNGSVISDDTCEPFPILDVDKDVASGPTPLGGGQFRVEYTLTASNAGAGDGTYDLSDALQFGPGIDIVDATVTNDSPGGIVPSTTWDGVGDTSIVDDQPIAAAADASTPTEHVYTVTVDVEIPAPLTAADADCVLEPGETASGLLNEVTLNGDTGTVEADDCIGAPLTEIDKDLADINPLGGNRYELVYELTATRISGGPGTYLLHDDLLLGDSLTTESVSATNLIPGSAPINPDFDGETDIDVVTAPVPIDDGDVHTYEITVVVAADIGAVTPGNSDCSLDAGESGTGAMNRATLDADGIEAEAEECQEFPAITPVKEIVSGPTPVGDGEYEVTYLITVLNAGAAAGDYDLDDELLFGSGIEPVSQSVRNVVPGGIVVNPDWDGVDDVMVVTGEAIAGAGADPAIHTYEVDVRVRTEADLDADAADCTLQPGEAGTGLLNQATTTVGPDSTVVDDCEGLPVTRPIKELVSVVGNGDGTSTLTYDIAVTRTGDGPGYTLTDEFAFGSPVTVDRVSVTDWPAGVRINDDFDGIDDTLIAPDVAIGDGDTHTYRVVVVASVDEAAVTPTNSDCTVGSESGSGFSNTAAATTNGVTATASDCEPLPGVGVDKSVASGPTALDDGTYEIVYDITATNEGAGGGEYTIEDTFAFGDGVTVVSAEVVNVDPGDIATDSDWDGVDEPVLVADQPISGAVDGVPEVHAYSVTVVVDLAAGVNAESGDCTVTGGEAGSGLLNNVTMVVNGEETEDEACAEIEGEGRIDIAKVVDETAAAPGDTVTYTVTATNVGTVDYTADRPAELVDDMSDVIDDAVWLDDLTASSGVASYAAPELRWTGPLAVGETVTLTYAVRIRTDTAGSGSMYNTVASVLSNANCGVDQLASGRQAARAELPSECETLTSIRLPAPPRAPRSPITPRPIPVTG